jgi:hypothetical protein
VIAGFLPAADVAVDARSLEPAGDRRTEQQMIDAQTGVAAFRK